MSLRDWLRAGWLDEHTSSREEISGLLGVADRDLGDCRTAGLSADWRFNIAYNAALQAATAALAAAGFRASRQSHHYRVIQWDLRHHRLLLHGPRCALRRVPALADDGQEAQEAATPAAVAAGARARRVKPFRSAECGVRSTE
jgi:hypothetical protein